MNLAPSYKNIFKIAAPIMAFNLVQNAIGFTDTIFLGRVGVVEMSACGIMAIYYLIFVMIGFGISRGAQILIARRAGEQKFGEIGKITDHLFILEMSMAVILFAFLHFASSFVVPWFIQSPEILNAGWEYLSYRSYGIFFSLFAFVLLALYTGVGTTRAILYVTLSLGVTNVVLNYALIFGRFGLPEMGIAGAGLASTISEFISAIVGLTYLIFDPLRKRLQCFRFNNFDFALIKKMMGLSMPLVLQFMVGMGGWFVFFTFLENLGDQALAISVVLRWLYTFYLIPGMGAGSAVNSLVSNAMGKEDFSGALLGIRKSVIFSLLGTVCLVLTLYLFPYAIANIFTDDMGIIENTPKLYPVLGTMLLVSSIATVVYNGLMGTGATRISLIIQIISVILYLGYAFVVINVLHQGLGYAWSSEIVYWGFLLIFTAIYFYTGRWRQHEV